MWTSEIDPRVRDVMVDRDGDRTAVAEWLTAYLTDQGGGPRRRTCSRPRTLRVSPSGRSRPPALVPVPGRSAGDLRQGAV